jgi:hypothetical protein
MIVEYDLALPTPQSYAGVLASLKNWLNRSDLDALLADFVVLAEEEMNRTLRVRQMETALAPTEIASGSITIPAGTAAIKTLWLSGRERDPMSPQSLDFVKANDYGGKATHFAWVGDQLYFNGTGTVNGILFQQIPTLSETNTSNWVLSVAPSCYLFGAMREAFDYVRDDTERDRWAARFLQVMDKINGADMRDRYSGQISIPSPIRF